MLKTFLISIILLLTNVIACGQHLTPKRIVFSGDTGIFFTHKQEIELLVKNIPVSPPKTIRLGVKS